MSLGTLSLVPIHRRHQTKAVPSPAPAVASCPRDFLAEDGWPWLAHGARGEWALATRNCRLGGHEPPDAEDTEVPPMTVQRPCPMQRLGVILEVGRPRTVRVGSLRWAP
jgi:hypothetical protein